MVYEIHIYISNTLNHLFVIISCNVIKHTYLFSTTLTFEYLSACLCLNIYKQKNRSPAKTYNVES